MAVLATGLAGSGAGAVLGACAADRGMVAGSALGAAIGALIGHEAGPRDDRGDVADASVPSPPRTFRRAYGSGVVLALRWIIRIAGGVLAILGGVAAVFVYLSYSDGRVNERITGAVLSLSMLLSAGGIAVVALVRPRARTIAAPHRVA